MKKLIFLIICLFSSCSHINENKNFDFDYDFSNNINLKEFEIKLDEYAKNSQYPDINN